LRGRREKKKTGERREGINELTGEYAYIRSGGSLVIAQ